jgi:hypothetical protein
MSAHDLCFVLGMCFFFFFWAVIVPIMGILIGFLTGFVGSFDFGWRWWTICLVYYWLVFLVLSNISFFGPFSRSFQFSPCKLYIFTVFFFFFFLRKLIFSMNFTCYGFKFSSLPFKKCDTSGLFSRKVLHWSRIKYSFFGSIKKKSSQSFNY